MTPPPNPPICVTITTLLPFAADVCPDISEVDAIAARLVKIFQAQEGVTTVAVVSTGCEGPVSVFSSLRFLSRI